MLDTIEPFIVKVCGVTSVEDARAALDAGANALGFNFYYQSPRCLTPARAQQIAQTVPSGILKVGVFVNATKQELSDVGSQVGLDVLQLHGNQLPLHFPDSFRIWRAIQASAKPSPHRIVEAYLLDTPTPDDASAQYGGSGQTFDWTLARAFPHRRILAGGLDGANVAEAIRIARPWGVDACSRLESSPGKKDPALVTAFVHAALAAFRLPQEINT
jgi:phosphoribosylanthranilate isomerase